MTHEDPSDNKPIIGADWDASRDKSFDSDFVGPNMLSKSHPECYDIDRNQLGGLAGNFSNVSWHPLRKPTLRQWLWGRILRRLMRRQFRNR
jgi:hypothetical protein